MGLLVTEIAQLVVVHQCKVGLAPVEGHLLAGLGVKLEGVGGIGLFPATHLHAAAGEEIGVAALDVLHLLHVVGVACVGVHVGEADHDVLEGELLTGQLIDGVLGGLLGGVVHLHRVGVAECGVAERGAVALRMYDGDFFGRGFTLELVDLVGAVVGKVEERPLAGSVEADAGIRSGLADLLAGGELGVLVGHIAAAVIAVGDDGVDRGLEIILAADVQPGVAVDADELGAEDALAVVVVEDVPGHEQLQELVAARAEGADLGDAVGVAEHGAQAGDAALDFGLDEQIGAADAPLGAGILALGVGDVVDHDGHRAAVGAARGAGEDVGVVLGHDAEGRVKLFALGRRGDGHVAGSFRRSSGLPFFGQALEQAGQLAAQRGASGRRAAGQGQRCRCQPGNMKDRPTRDFHDKTASYQKAPPYTGRDSAFCFDCTVSRPICKEEVAARISASQRSDGKTGFYKRNGCSPGGGLCAAERHFFALSSCFFGAGVVI